MVPTAADDARARSEVAVLELSDDGPSNPNNAPRQMLHVDVLFCPAVQPNSSKTSGGIPAGGVDISCALPQTTILY